MLTITWKSINKKDHNFRSPDRVLNDLPILRAFFVGQHNNEDIRVDENTMRDFLKDLHRNEDGIEETEYDVMESFAYAKVHSFKWDQWDLVVNCKW